MIMIVRQVVILSESDYILDRCGTNCKSKNLTTRTFSHLINIGTFFCSSVHFEAFVPTQFSKTANSNVNVTNGAFWWKGKHICYFIMSYNKSIRSLCFSWVVKPWDCEFSSKWCQKQILLTLFQLTISMKPEKTRQSLEKGFSHIVPLLLLLLSVVGLGGAFHLTLLFLCYSKIKMVRRSVQLFHPNLGLWQRVVTLQRKVNIATKYRYENGILFYFSTRSFSFLQKAFLPTTIQYLRI